MNTGPVQLQLQIASYAGTLAELCAVLPKLPSVIRYYDEFDDTVRSIKDPFDQPKFEIFFGGQRTFLDFVSAGYECGYVYKHVFAYILARDTSIVTVANRISAILRYFAPKDLAELVDAGPTRIGSVWAAMRAAEFPASVYIASKYVLQLLCAYRLNGWTDDFLPFISSTLPLPAQDKYTRVRSGDVFLSADEEALLVRHIDNVVEKLASNVERQISQAELADTAMLVCAYQFAMRPIQIAMLDVRHVRIWNDRDSGQTSVHLTFHVAKQRGSKKNLAMTRRVKAEWIPIFTHWKTHLDAIGVKASQKFFQAESNREVGFRIATLVRRLLDTDNLGTATDLRHTAAQRLVDAGASHEELAEFLGHSHTDTGLVYFEASASHAERVNRALGASEVYRQVAKIAHDRFISAEELIRLKGEQQIAAVPHGIPVSGIGGCLSGQPACPYNPVTSCYGCRKFMPVHDRALHEKVLSDMREVVLFFDGSARGDTHSPAYMQLQRTISEIQSVIGELDEAAP